MSSTLITEDRLVIKRTFAAPIGRVYQAWIDPAKLARWFVPNERWVETTVETEAVPGGRHHITMRHSDGDVFHLEGNYLDIVPNERISFTWNWREAPYGTGESVVHVEFRAVPGGTELTLTHDGLTDRKEREETAAGWAGCLDSLAGYLPGSETASE